MRYAGRQRLDRHALLGRDDVEAEVIVPDGGGREPGGGDRAHVHLDPVSLALGEGPVGGEAQRPLVFPARLARNGRIEAEDSPGASVPASPAALVSTTLTSTRGHETRRIRLDPRRVRRPGRALATRERAGESYQGGQGNDGTHTRCAMAGEIREKSSISTCLTPVRASLAAWCAAFRARRRGGARPVYTRLQAGARRWPRAGTRGARPWATRTSARGAGWRRPFAPSTPGPRLPSSPRYAATSSISTRMPCSLSQSAVSSFTTSGWLCFMPIRKWIRKQPPLPVLLVMTTGLPSSAGR